MFTSPKKQKKISCCKRLAKIWPRDPFRGRWERMSLDRRSCDIIHQCMPRNKGVTPETKDPIRGTAERVTDSETCVLSNLRLSKTLGKLPRCKDPRLLNLRYPNIQGAPGPMATRNWRIYPKVADPGQLSYLVINFK